MPYFMMVSNQCNTKAQTKHGAEAQNTPHRLDSRRDFHHLDFLGAAETYVRLGRARGACIAVVAPCSHNVGALAPHDASWARYFPSESHPWLRTNHTV
jgi:hypothetical protein